jgi:hypothetical protein
MSNINTDPATFWSQACATVPRPENLYQLAVEFLLDCVDPEGYGHAMPPDAIKRANRILAMSEAQRKGKPYTPGAAPPPARCERCDSE